jgi:hypothetical protein
MDTDVFDEDSAEIYTRSEPRDSDVDTQGEESSVQPRELQEDSTLYQDQHPSIEARHARPDGFIVIKRGSSSHGSGGGGPVLKPKIAHDGKAATTPPKKLPPPVKAAKPTGDLHRDLHATNVIAKNHRAEDGRLLKTAVTANRKDAKLYPSDAKADHAANQKWRSFAKADRKNDFNSLDHGIAKIKAVDGGKGGGGGGYGRGGHH